jgi:hypothetical protein
VLRRESSPIWQCRPSDEHVQSRIIGGRTVHIQTPTVGDAALIATTVD